MATRSLSLLVLSLASLLALTAAVELPSASFYCHLERSSPRSFTFSALCAVPKEAEEISDAFVAWHQDEQTTRHKAKSGFQQQKALQVTMNAIASENANDVRLNAAAARLQAAVGEKHRNQHHQHRRHLDVCSVPVDSSASDDIIFSADVGSCLPSGLLPFGDIRYIEVTIKAFAGADLEGILFTYPLVDPSAAAIQALQTAVAAITQQLTDFAACVTVQNNLVTLLPTCNTLVQSGAAGTGNLYMQPASAGTPTFSGTGNLVVGPAQTVSGTGNLVVGDTADPNSVSGSHNIVGGGKQTVTGDFNVAAGYGNTISSNAVNNFVAGHSNTFSSYRSYNSIVGGLNNQITGGYFNVIAGGSENVISSTRQKNSIHGGGGNTISHGAWGVLSGGSGNSITSPDAEVPRYGSVFGGASNKVQPAGTCALASVLNDECSQGATVVGGSSNTAQGRFSLAVGSTNKNVVGKNSVA